MANFAVMGVGGYIAPRHLKAIKETGNNLIVALDPRDSVGILDSYSSNVAFFTEFERFDRYLEKRRIAGEPKIDYVSICSPNYLHDAHIRFALRIGANAICEKPIVLNPWNLDALEQLEKETGKKVYSILQLRLHPEIKKLKEKIENGPKDKIYNIDLNYITTRGPWYFVSWKGDIQKSGGIATNIGVHFFDMLLWIFGSLKSFKVTLSDNKKMRGTLELERANVNWFLSLDLNDVPKEVLSKGIKTYRSLKIDNDEFEFSEGFTDLHTESYKQILAGNGFGIKEVRPAIDLVSKLRSTKIDS